MTLDQLARAMYESRDYLSHPTWGQLGDTTKGYWRDQVLGQWA